MVKRRLDLTKTWIVLYSITAILFLVVGVAMIFADSEYLVGGQYLITATIFLMALFLIKKKKVSSQFSNPATNLGFIFSVLGLTSSLSSGWCIGAWGLGIILFLSGLFCAKDAYKKE